MNTQDQIKEAVKKIEKYNDLITDYKLLVASQHISINELAKDMLISLRNRKNWRALLNPLYIFRSKSTETDEEVYKHLKSCYSGVVDNKLCFSDIYDFFDKQRTLEYNKPSYCALSLDLDKPLEDQIKEAVSNC